MVTYNKSLFLRHRDPSADGVGDLFGIASSPDNYRDPRNDVGLLKGFTLVELLVAISIIAVLSAILLPNFMGARERAEDAKKKEDLVAVKNALRMFYNDTQNYPLTSLGMAGVGATIAPYLPNVSQIGFSYAQTNSGDGFQLCVGLATAIGGDATKSQLNCVVNNLVCGVGLTTDLNLYVICGN